MESTNGTLLTNVTSWKPVTEKDFTCEFYLTNLMYLFFRPVINKNGGWMASNLYVYFDLGLGGRFST